MGFIYWFLFICVSLYVYYVKCDISSKLCVFISRVKNSIFKLKIFIVKLFVVKKYLWNHFICVCENNKIKTMRQYIYCKFIHAKTM